MASVHFMLAICMIVGAYVWINRVIKLGLPQTPAL